MTTPADDLLAVVRLLVDEPGAARVEERALDGGIELQIAVAPGDRGKVIGRRGRTVDALRTLAEVRGEREGRSIAVELPET